MTDVVGELRSALADHTSAVLVAPPGAGKTTAVPLLLLDEPWIAGQRIVVLEPRRLATRAAAQRMAQLLGEQVGNTVGYQTRDERRIGDRTRIEVVTEGVLTRRLQHDPSLPDVGLVVFDEVHERNVPTDLGLAFSLDVQATLRPDLRLLAMSATPHLGSLQRVLHGPIVTSDGRAHAVDIVWAPPRKGERIEQFMAALVLRAIREQHGDVLVFLPGIGEIRRVERALEGQLDAGVDVLPLAGALSLAEHDAALAPSGRGRRRVVLATDIAESSLTVSGVRVVVDAGLARVPRFDPRTGMTRLTTVTASRASTEQRAGRAGRLEPGVCYRAWSKVEQQTRLAHLPAEITQVDAAGVALELAMWGTPVDQLALLDPPPRRALDQARALLTDLGLLDEAGRPTDEGRAAAALPVHPRLGRMIVASQRWGLGLLGCVLAALVDERDVFRGAPDQLPVDLSLRVDAVAGWRRHDLADQRDVSRVRQRAIDLARRGRISGDIDSVRSEQVGLVLGLAFPDRLASRRSQPGQFQLRGGTSAFVNATDSLASEAFVVAADLDGNRKGARIRLGAALDGDEVARLFADEVELVETLEWDRTRNDLVARSTLKLGSLRLDERVVRPTPGSDTVAALVERVRATNLAALEQLPHADAWRARVAYLHRHAPQRWPDLSDAALLRTLPQWLAPHLVTATGAADLARLDVALALTSELGWDRCVALHNEAPPTFTTPSGRAVAIDYSRASPTARARVQDLFGLTTHPALPDGTAITLELLSPADRPIQITSDLPGFWRGSWADVRKEMAGRYPKHHWPVDPAGAPPNRTKP